MKKEILKITDTANQTPIEIALGIDENGMTTATKLYLFLDLNPSNFTKWCKRNITDNKFATERVDYHRLVIKYESAIKGKTKTDYKLTANFAKKLSMTGNTEKHEQARNYFIACEQGLKVATQKIQNQPDMQPLIDALTTITSTVSTMQQDIQELKQSQRNRFLLEKRYPSAWYKKMAPKYKMLMEYFKISREELYSNIYKELEDIYDVDINQIYEDYCYENHLLKDECFRMDAIEHNTQLRDALTTLIDFSLVRYGIQTEEQIKNFKRETIFDQKGIYEIKENE